MDWRHGWAWRAMRTLSPFSSSRRAGALGGDEARRNVTGGEATLDRGEFWSLIEDVREKSDGDCERLVELLESRLSRLPADEIVAFQTILYELLAEAYTWELWAAAYLINGGCSDDGFDYFRAWLI